MGPRQTAAFRSPTWKANMQPTSDANAFTPGRQLAADPRGRPSDNHSRRSPALRLSVSPPRINPKGTFSEYQIPRPAPARFEMVDTEAGCDVWRVSWRPVRTSAYLADRAMVFFRSGPPTAAPAVLGLKSDAARRRVADGRRAPTMSFHRRPAAARITPARANRQASPSRPTRTRGLPRLSNDLGPDNDFGIDRSVQRANSGPVRFSTGQSPRPSSPRTVR